MFFLALAANGEGERKRETRNDRAEIKLASGGRTERDEDGSGRGWVGAEPGSARFIRGWPSPGV